MTTMEQPIVRTGAARSHRALGALATVAVFAGCAGENLFSIAGAVGAVGPEVEISAPAPGLSVALGASVTVVAAVSAPAGAAALLIRSPYDDGSGDVAYVQVTDNALGGVLAFSVNEALGPAVGQTGGSAYIVVEVTDGVGETSKDSVKVTITP